MADLKISQLTSATLPLAGTEVLPIVQSSSTKKVATDDLTVKNVRSNATTGILQIAGPAASSTRTMTVPDANFTAARTDAAQTFTGDQTLGTGNLVQGTAAKGVNFTANTPAAGMTSQLLNWYEEGTWTPSCGGTTTYNTQQGYYTRIGRQVTAWFFIDINAIGTGTNNRFSGLPFTNNANQLGSGSIGYFANLAVNQTFLSCYVGAGSSNISFSGRDTAAASMTNLPAVIGNGTQIYGQVTYFV